MKKLVLIFAFAVGTLTVTAQNSRPASSSKIAEFNKLVSVYTTGQRVDVNKLNSLYNEINCTLIDVQAEAIDANIATNREDICGSSEFPRTQLVSDADFKKYAEIVAKYLAYKNK